MEQKKTLWIIAAVGAFLLVVLGTAGFFYYSPANKASPTIARTSLSENLNSSSGWTSTPQNSTTNQSTSLIDLSKDSVSKVSDVLVLTDNATTIDLNSLKNAVNNEADFYTSTESQVATPNAAAAQNINITVNIPETKETNYITEPVFDSKNTSASSLAISEKLTSSASTSQKVVKTETKVENKNSTPVVKKSTAKAQVKANENTTVTATLNKSEVAKTQFWVQVAAYSNKKGAEGARSVLDSNKIPSDIFTYKDNKDKLFYRVRVGPYTTKSEAEYWRSRIIKINEFSKAESYITSTTN